MICKECGTEVLSDDRFCPTCGAKIEEEKNAVEDRLSKILAEAEKPVLGDDTEPDSLKNSAQTEEKVSDASEGQSIVKFKPGFSQVLPQLIAAGASALSLAFFVMGLTSSTGIGQVICIIGCIIALACIAVGTLQLMTIFNSFVAVKGTLVGGSACGMFCLMNERFKFELSSLNEVKPGNGLIALRNGNKIYVCCVQNSKAAAETIKSKQ